jgi:MFS family permease
MALRARARPVARPGTTAPLNLTLLALVTAGVTVSVQQTLVIPLLPRLMGTFDTTVTAITWVFTASLLAAAVATPLLSRLGDMYGKKRLILVAMGLLVAGSVLCALSSSLGVLIAGRALQGTSIAMIPLAIGMIRDTFPRHRVTAAIGVVSASLGIGGNLGMLLTGLIAARTDDHRPAFWIAAGMAAAGMVLVAWVAPADGGRVGGRPDYPGAAVLAAWLLCLLLAISQGNAWGWTSAGVLGLFAGALVLCAVWVVIELRVRAPLVAIGLLIGAQSLPANLASLLAGFSMYAGFTMNAQIIQVPAGHGYGLGGTVLDVGLLAIPGTAAMLLTAPPTGRLAQRIGAAFTLVVGLIFSCLGYLWLAVSNAHAIDFLGSGALQGVGFGVAYAALGTLAVQHVPMDQSGIASGINALVRTGGGSVAGAVTAAVLLAHTPAGAGVATQTGYVQCFLLAAAAAALAALVAIVHGVRHQPVKGRVEALETS